MHTETIPAARSSAKLQKVVDASRAKFNQVDMEQQLILHEQLSLHQNQYTSKIQRRFSKFKCTGNVWTDTAGVRTVAPIESAAAAFKRLHLNSSWYVHTYVSPGIYPFVRTYICIYNTLFIV